MSDKPKVDWADDQLLKLLQSGDESAFNILYRRYWKRLYNAAFKRLQEESLCEIAVQNVFIDLWNRRKTIVVQNLPSFLFTAVKYQVFTLARETSKTLYFEEPLAQMTASPFSADGAILDQELQSLFEQWKLALPKKRKKIFQLYFEDQLSSGEIAELLNISQKTVQNQVRTAAQNLRTQIAQFLSLFL